LNKPRFGKSCILRFQIFSADVRKGAARMRRSYA
jgi:hypothetical protein